MHIDGMHMKRSLSKPAQWTFTRLALTLIVVCGWMGSPGLVAGADDGIIQDHYIIKLRPNENAAAVANEMALTHGLGLGHTYRHALHGFSAFVPQGRLNALRSDPRIVSIVADRYMSIDKPPCASCGGGGTGTQPPQVIPAGILRINGDLSSTQSGNGAGAVDVDVAVIDTGIYNHGDLNVVGGKNCSTGKSYTDGNGHGTHVLPKPHPAIRRSGPRRGADDRRLDRLLEIRG